MAARPVTGAPRDRSGTATAREFRDVPWSEVDRLLRGLAGRIPQSFDAESIVGLAKGGIYAGEGLALLLRRPFFPVRLGRRSRDVGAHVPAASEIVPPEVRGRRVLVIDDVAGTGTSLRAAVELARAAGATEVRTAALAVREGGFRPDFGAVESPQLLVFPWDYEATAALADPGVADPAELGV